MQAVTFAIPSNWTILFIRQFYMNLSNVESKATKNMVILSSECID